MIDVSHGGLESHLGNYDAYLERLQRAEANPALTARTNAERSRAGGPAGDHPAAAGEERSEKNDRQRERERRKARERDLRRLEKLEARIAEEESRIERLKQSFADPEIARDYERIRPLQAEQSSLQAGLDALYVEWEALSEAASQGPSDGAYDPKPEATSDR